MESIAKIADPKIFCINEFLLRENFALLRNMMPWGFREMFRELRDRCALGAIDNRKIPFRSFAPASRHRRIFSAAGMHDISGRRDPRAGHLRSRGTHPIQ